MKESQEGFCMPLSAPSYPPPPYWTRPEGGGIAIFFHADIEALEKEIPEPLTLAPDALCRVWINDLSQPPHTFGLCHEGLISIRVKYQNIIGWYMSYLWISNDEVMSCCRELYGWPAQLCDDERLRYNGSQVSGECHRNGERIMRVTWNVTSPPPSKRDQALENEYLQIAGGDSLQIRKFPSPEKDGTPIKQLLQIHKQDASFKELWKGNATLVLEESSYYPNLVKLKPRKIVASYFLRSEFVLPYAKIIWEKK